MPVYLNSRDAAAQNIGLIHIPDVYDLLSGAQQNCGKHLRLRYMLKLKQYSVEETDVNKNLECWKFSFLSSSQLIYDTELVCEYLLWLSGDWLITWFNLDVFSFVYSSMSLYCFCKWQLCSRVPKWQEENAAADGKSRHYIGALLRCYSQSCHFPEEKDVPCRQAEGRQAVCTEDSGEEDAGEWAVFTVSKETSNTASKLR